MIRQTAGLIAEDLGGGVGVAADVRISFNGRVSGQFTDPAVEISGTPLMEDVKAFLLTQPPADSLYLPGVADSPSSSDAEETAPGRIERLKERWDALKNEGLERLDVERERRASVRVAYDFYRRDQAFAGSLLAGGLSVKLFLWFLPFSLSVVVLVGTLAERFDRPPSDLAHDSGLTAALTGMVEDAVEASESARLYLAILGVFLLLWTGLGVVRALRLTSRLAWGMTSTPPMRALVGSLSVVGFVLAILALQWARDRLLGGPWYLDLLVQILAILGVIALQIVLLNSLPRPSGVYWTALIPGALLMTAGLLIIRLATVVYFSRRLDNASELYGGLGLAAVFLAWLYVISRTLVASISLNATIWQRNRSEPPPQRLMT
jgi:uncharacterized BrkB/YihY/UPF0761 family membrane protein